MEFLQSAPAETTSYMIAGYTVIFGVIFLYVVSLIARQRNLEGDFDLLEEMGGQGN